MTEILFYILLFQINILILLMIIVYSKKVYQTYLFIRKKIKKYIEDNLFYCYECKKYYKWKKMNDNKDYCILCDNIRRGIK